MATLMICADIDCNVYIDTEHYGIAKSNTYFNIQLNQGVYWVECRCILDEELSYDFDFKAVSDTDKKEVHVGLLYNYRLKTLKILYDYVGEFEKGYAEVRHKDVLIGYIDKTYQLKYDDVKVLRDDILCVVRNNLYGVINNGEEIIPAKYNSIKLLGERMLRLELNNRFCLANLSGLKLTPLKYRTIEYAMNGIYAMYFNGWQFFDSDINEVDMPNNAIKYTVNDNKSLVVNKKHERPTSMYYNVFNQEPYFHYFHNGEGLMMFKKDVTMIGDSAFERCDSLTSIVIPKSIISIGENAFSYCANLVDITIPDNVVSVGKCAFSFCGKLSEFKGKFISEDGRCLILNGVLNSFAPYGISNYTVPDEVVSIGDFSFADCQSLIKVTLPKGLKSIGNYAFSWCKKLTEIDIADSIASIGNYAFKCCCSLTSINIPSNVFTVQAGTFYGCSSLMSVIIGDNVKKIDVSAFDNCINLIQIHLPNYLTQIEDGAFRSCISLREVIIPDSVTEIGTNAFSGCSSLKRLTMSNNITVIKAGTFFGCKCLTKFSIPNNVEAVGEFAFSGCTGLTNIEIPANAKYIDQDAFSGCERLRNVSISRNVEYIGKSAFWGCTSLESVYCKPLTPPKAIKYGGYWGAFDFSDKEYNIQHIHCKIYVPHQALESYKYSYLWSNYSDQIIGYDFDKD